jgi:hypothetical protein
MHGLQWDYSFNNHSSEIRRLFVFTTTRYSVAPCNVSQHSLLSRWGVVTISFNLQAAGPPIFGCPRLLIRHAGSYPSYLEAASSVRHPKTRHGVVTGKHKMASILKVFLNSISRFYERRDKHLVLNEALRHENVWGTRGIVLRILNLSTIWRWMVSFTPLPLYPRRKGPDRSLGGLWIWYGRGGEESYPFITAAGSRTPIVQFVA